MKKTKQEAKVEFIDFVRQVAPYVEFSPFHLSYYRVLDAFARRDIRRLIVTVPPQHGKSLGASVLLPAYMLGRDPSLRIAIASYSGSLANRFNRRVQRIIDTPEYSELFPVTTIKSKRSSGGDTAQYVRTSDFVEIVGHSGEVMSVGREGALTGNQVDIFILDDLYRDAMEGNSPTVRENCWDWYTSVVKTRMHNSSSELIVFTRWHEDDLVGAIMAKERVVPLTEWGQLTGGDADGWLLLNFEAIKENDPTQIDPRAQGEALWPDRHSVKLLAEKRNLDSRRFACMYQGRPSSRDGLLYGDRFGTYESLPPNTVKCGNYTDTADTGDDYLCSVCYRVGKDGLVYVTDVVYSREPMEVTEGMVAEMLRRNDVRTALVESNNGGRGFARAVARLAPITRVEWFHQSGNKEARILSNAATVLSRIVMPHDWVLRWGELYVHLTTYSRKYETNRWHDAADVFTGIVEHEVTEVISKKVRAVKFLG